MNKIIKNLSVGIIGGMIPLGAFLFMQNNTNEGKQSNNQTNTKRTNLISTTPVNFSATPAVVGEDFTLASENSLNSVVHVTTRVKMTSVQRDPYLELFFGPGAGRQQERYGEGSGSGVIVSDDGYIVTNNHVIDGANEIQVTLNDNSTYSAKIIGTDPNTDLAVLKIEATNLSPIQIGNSDNIRVGEWVLAVGNPFNLTSTVTAGIVSAKGRNINIIGSEGKSKAPVESFIQTDAAVNPGNSGGALVNTRGELIGINTAIASRTGSYAGYSFAVPSKLVQKVMIDLMDYGMVQRGYLGVQIAEVNQDLKDKEELFGLDGVYIAEVIEDSGADNAKIKAGEVILKVGSKNVNSPAELQEEIAKRRPGDKVQLTLRQKDGSEEIKEVLLRNSEGDTKLKSKAEIEKYSALGATFAALSNKEKKELNIDNGVKITALNAGKLKALGLSEGYIISKVNNTVITSVEQLRALLNKQNGGVLLEVISPSGVKDYVGFGL
ncbi:MAG: Do family serine endopeptidase [Lishizhenia sp.]